MADRRDFYYRQKVLEDELDAPFTALEAADWALSADIGLNRDDSQPDVYGGIMSGFTVAYQSGLDVSVALGVGYDSQGRRVATGTSYSVTVSNAGDTTTGAGGVASGSDISPTEGYERWVGLFIVYDRKLTDPRYDGYNTEVYFDRAESFHFYLSAGGEKTIGTLLDADKPARENDKLLLADIRIKTLSSVTSYVSLSQARREWFLNLTATNAPNKNITRGLMRDGLLDMLEMYNEHVNGNADRHSAEDIDFTANSLWADGTGGTFGAASEVDGGLEGIVTDLAKQTDVTGAARVGAKAAGGVLSTPSTAGVTTIQAGDVEDQLATLVAAVNGRVFRGGDMGIAGAIGPAATGTALGGTANRWDLFLQNMNISGGVTGHFNPSSSLTYTLGTNSLRWGPTYVNSLDAASDITGAGDFLLAGSGTMDVEGTGTFNNLGLYSRTDVPYLVNLMHGTTLVDGSSTATYTFTSEGPVWDLTRSGNDSCFLRFYIDDFPDGATLTTISFDTTCGLQATVGASATIYRGTWGGYTAPTWTRLIMNSTGPDTNLPNTTAVHAVLYHVCNQNNTDLTSRTCDVAGSSSGGDMISIEIQPGASGGRILVHAITLEFTHTQTGKWYKAL